MSETIVATSLDYFSRMGAALFPCAAGTKRPILAWKEGSTFDPAAWTLWATQGCNLAIDAAKSGLLIIDIDSSKVTPAEAWQAYSDICKSWGLATAPGPMTQSARGGWHVPFRRPAHIPAESLRGGGTLVRISDIRDLNPGEIDGEVIGFKNRGYCIAPGSTFEDKPYLLFPDAPEPHHAPDILLQTLALPVASKPVMPFAQTVGTGNFIYADIESDINILLAKTSYFDGEAEWTKSVWALRHDFGDAGWPLAEKISYCDDNNRLEDVWARDQSSKAAPSTCASLRKEAALARRATMFDTVAQMATAAGATLSSMPLPPGTASATGSMFTGQQALADRCAPILATFLAATAGAPTRPAANECLALPAAMEGHGLYEQMNDVILRVLAMATRDSSYKWSGETIKSAMAVLKVLHQDVFDAVRRQVESNGRRFPTRAVNLEAKGIEEEVQRDTALPEGDWVYDPRSGLPEADNPDNLKVFLGIIGAEVRQNVWYNRPEIRGFEWAEWSPLQDVILAKLKRRALRTKTRFRVSSEFLKEQVMALADDNRQDPVLDHINSLVWDGVPRIHSWLSATCGVPAGDSYFEAVSRNVIGGMVKRIRDPGAKHDEVLILMGPQGCGKSNLTKALAIQPEYHTDSVTFDGTPQNVIPQLFGKIIVELSELDGMAKKEVQSIKRFISSENDNFTAKYQAFATDRPRRCIFVGTSNEHNPLVDITGNRRFLPVRVEQRVDTTWLRENIGQMLAEAAVLHAAGETFSIPEDVWDVAATHQEGARSVSDIEARLHHWFGETLHTAVAFVTVPDLADLSEICGWRNLHSFRNQVLRGLGFREEKPYIDGKRTNVYLRGPKMLPRHVEGITRYRVTKDQTTGRPMVQIRSQPVTGAAPPLPTAPAPGGPPMPPY